MSAVLTLTRGLPGSGKTSWAKAQPDTVRVNRDELRAMMRADWPHGDPRWEHLCTIIQAGHIAVLLLAGLHVVCDDTNLDPHVVARLTDLATRARATVRVVDFTTVPLSVCIKRDATRPNPVGAHVIRRIWARYVADTDPYRTMRGDVTLDGDRDGHGA